MQNADCRIPHPSPKAGEGWGTRPADGRISGTVVDSEGKPVPSATVSLIEQNVSLTDDPYSAEVTADKQGHFDFHETLRHGVYDVYARNESAGYPDRRSPFYKPIAFQPDTVQLIGPHPAAELQIRELVPPGSEIWVHVQAFDPSAHWSEFSSKQTLLPGEERTLDVRLYKERSN